MRLRRADHTEPGITRVRNGRGFIYLDERGVRLRDPAVLERIKALAIPPAWDDVWVCPYANGHFQAVGTDGLGRRQYLYHDAWTRRQASAKFDQMVEFARALPGLRAEVAAWLDDEALSKRRVLACAVRLLDLGFFRLGGERYVEHGTYGLATLEKRHVRLQGDGVLVFDYVAKGRKRRVQSIVDARVFETAARLKRRRSGGNAFLAYKNGSWTNLQSGQINAFIKTLAGPSFSAKDFRTWHATVLAAVGLAVSDGVSTTSARRRAIARAVGEVAHYLGNTPAVCRASYIDPRVIDRYLEGETIVRAVTGLGEHIDGDAAPTDGRIEAAVLALLNDKRSS